MLLRIATGTLDLQRAQFEHDDGETHRLTQREVAMLRYLHDHIGEDVSRDDLRVEVWQQHELSMSRAIDTAVTRLRRKIERDPTRPEVLCTAHGQGYRLVLRPEVTVPVAATVQAARCIDLGSVAVDLSAGLVRTGLETVTLTAQERNLLIVLSDRPGSVVDFGRLARAAGVTGGRRALFNAVHRLRQKIEADPSDPKWLIGVRGHGYRLDVHDRAPTALSSLRQTLWTVADQLARVLGLDDCVVYTRDGNHLVQAAAYGVKAPSRGELEAPIALRIGEGIVGTAARSGEAQIIRDVRSDHRYVADLAPARSELAVPVVHQGRIVGVLDSESPRLAAYAEQHLAVFEAFSAIAAAALGDLGHALSRGPRELSA